MLINAGHAVDGLLGLVLDQAGHRDRAAGGNFQRGFGAAGLDRGNVDATDVDRIVVREFGDFRHHPQADLAFGQHDRGEVERDAELLEGDRWRALSDGARIVVWQVTPVGNGNSPPTMKVADSPEMAVRLGSASVRITPALSMARRVA